MTETRLAAPEDRTLSPLTGYTRAHWIEILTRLVRGVAPHVNRETGIPHLPGDPAETALPRQLVNPGGPTEAFDRTMLLAALYMVAAGRSTIDGYDADIAELYRRGIVTCLDYAENRKSHPRFGSAGMLAMLIAPEQLVEPLGQATTQRLGEYVARRVGRRRRSESNLLLFSMMPAALLDRLGVEYDRDTLDGHFDRILSMYRGSGWFIDGWNRGFDHYNFWGFQFYLHAFMAFDPRWRNRYADRVREITAAHEATVPYYFGRDGGPIPKGRSLNYRFAILSGVAMAQMSGLNAMDPGLARRISSGCLKYFRDRGCVNDRGLLSIGFRGSNAAIGEDYTDTGAPYWASTGLTALALPADHPFWTAGEQPMPADTPGVKRCCIRGGEMVLKVDGDRGEARMLTVGEPFLHRNIWQAGSKYYQHAYSSTLGYALAGDLGGELPAGRTGLSADGETWAYRTWPRVVAMDATRARHEWDAWASLEGLTGKVVTESTFLDRGEIHVFWHTADEPRYLRVGGYAVRLDHDENVVADSRDGALVVTSSEAESILQPLGGSPAGEVAVRELRPREGFVHSHIFEGWSAFPVWTSAEPVAAGVKAAVYVDAARRGDRPGVDLCPPSAVEEVL